MLNKIISNDQLLNKIGTSMHDINGQNGIVTNIQTITLE